MRKGATPTVASRWLQRLLAVGGKSFAAALRENGRDYQQWAGMLDQGITQPLAKRPEPKPAAEHQPRSYLLQRSEPAAARPLRRLCPPYPAPRSRSIPSTAIRAPPNAVRCITRSSSVSCARNWMRHFATGARGNEPDLNEAFDEQALPAHIDIVWRPRFAAVGKAFINWEISAPGRCPQQLY